MTLVKSKINSLAWLKSAIYISVVGGVTLFSTRVLAAAFFVLPTTDTENNLSLTVRQNLFEGTMSTLVFPGTNWTATFNITETNGNLLFGYDTLTINVVLLHKANPDPRDNAAQQFNFDFYLDSTNPKGRQKSISGFGSGAHGVKNRDIATGLLTANINSNAVNTDINSWTLNVNARHVPEPLTMLGAATAVGYGALLKRKYSENKKS